jgi:hypothetical protein
MASADRPTIKSGEQIVHEFVGNLKPGESLDADTITSIQELYKTDKLTKTRLPQALEANRSRILGTGTDRDHGSP